MNIKFCDQSELTFGGNHGQYQNLLAPWVTMGITEEKNDSVFYYIQFIDIFQTDLSSGGITNSRSCSDGPRADADMQGFSICTHSLIC